MFYFLYYLIIIWKQIFETVDRVEVSLSSLGGWLPGNAYLCAEVVAELKEEDKWYTDE